MNAGHSPNSSIHLPICVDLDGTLVHTDMLWESAVRAIKRDPLLLFRIVIWLLMGRGRLKEELAIRAQIDVALLPYNKVLVDELRRRRQAGHSIWLATASSEILARQVANHLGFFDGFMASDRLTNLKGRTKAARLVEQFGDRSFAYVGDARADIAVWQHANQAWVVGPISLASLASEQAQVLWHQERPSTRLAAVLRAMRVHQWVKNLLVLLPAILAHQILVPTTLGNALLGFMAFNFGASAIYLVNDLLDLDADRLHPRKRTRPLASGQLSIIGGIATSALCLTFALIICVWLPTSFLLAFGVYIALTTVYSLLLKTIPMADAVVLAGLFTLRIVAGSAATGIAPSFWLLNFSMFIFLSLALLKRYAELHMMREAGGRTAHGRGYRVDDMQVVLALGCAAGMGAVLVLGFYIDSPQVLRSYSHPVRLWGLCALLSYWISYVWIRAARGEMHDDPIVFAANDRASQIVASLTVVIAVLAL